MNTNLINQTKTNIQVKDLAAICNQTTDINNYPHATAVVKNILQYEGDDLRKLNSSQEMRGLKQEFNTALKDGPGVILIKKFYDNPQLLEKVNNTFYQIIEKENMSAGSQGDHFAKDSPNARIWNVFEKMLYADAEQFFFYYGNPLYSLVAEAWLGPSYQMTAQVNFIRPGSAAQIAHRDYHLGFQDSHVIEQFPQSVQISSQFLTLQGAVAHCNMPLESGPTLFLPFSQTYPLGYEAMRRIEFVEYFDSHYVQLELNCGDAVFFSPALFHAAGANKSKNINRIGNLLQISSAFGKPMERVNLSLMSKTIYPILLKKVTEDEAALTSKEMDTIIKAVANGYPFPNNLDIMQPKPGSLTPTTDQDILRLALSQRMSVNEFSTKLDANQVLFLKY